MGSSGGEDFGATGSLNPFEGRDVPWLVDRQAERFGAKPFLFWHPFEGDRRVCSFADLALETRSFAAGMAARGVKAGDAVLIHMENHPALIIAWLACARLGALAVTTNTRSSQDEFAYFAQNSGAAFLITERRYLELAVGIENRFSWIAIIDGDDVSGTIAFDDLRGDPDQCPVRPANPMLPCSVMYTSGTTSRPKGVVWTHANALWGGQVNASHFAVSPDDRCLIFLPLFHAVALSWNFLASLHAGGSVVLLPKYSASRFWPVAADYGCTWANMVTFTIQALFRQPMPERHMFRTWVCAGDVAIVEKTWGIRTMGSYGMTELISQPICSDVANPGPENSMGRARPEYQVALRREDGTRADIGESGDIWIGAVPGVSIFHSYLGNPEATAAAFDAQGWFDTGDQGYITPDGEIFYTGRAKDMLKVGGENVAAVEIEAVIATVDGVREVAVVGKPDDMLNEVPVAFVVSDLPAATLRDAIDRICLDLLSDFKRPRGVHVIEQIPKGLLDKVLKRELRELARQLYTE